MTGNSEAPEGNGRHCPLRDIGIKLYVLLEVEVKTADDDCRKAAICLVHPCLQGLDADSPVLNRCKNGIKGRLNFELVVQCSRYPQATYSQNLAYLVR